MLGSGACSVALRQILEQENGDGGIYYKRIYESDVYAQSISGETVDEIFGDRISMSPSGLEKYVKCHFDYYCNYVLRLRGDERNRFSFNDMGTLVHAVLEEFVRSVTDENGFNAELAAQMLDTLPDLVEKYASDRLPAEADNARMRRTLVRLKNLSRLVAGNVVGEYANSGFVPTFFEMKIGYGDDAGIKPTEYRGNNGKTAVFTGIVDRVDLMKRGNDVYVKVVDYKTGTKEFKLDNIESGLNVQILLYLFNICYGQDDTRIKMGCGEGGRLLPAGAVYMSSKIGSINASAENSSETVLRLADEQIKRRGVILSDSSVISKSGKGDGCEVASDDGVDGGFAELNQRLTEAVCSIVGSLTDGDASIDPLESEDPCKYCDMRAVCRRELKMKYEEEEEE